MQSCLALVLGLTALASTAANQAKFDAGLLTLNSTTNATLFHWYFPPQNGDPNAPLVMWLQGGPGSSGLIGLFFEMGPYALTKHEAPSGDWYEMTPRATTWNQEYGMLFVDSPVGTGYSYTDTDDGYANTETDIATALWTLLQDFYANHPDLLYNELYTCGESYGGHMVPNLATHIVEMNNKIRAGDAELKVRPSLR
jgi:vitellogenic carboxypeptidase-like protein